MHDSEISETPKNTGVPRNYASIGSRFLAGIIDLLVVLGVDFVLFVMLLKTAKRQGLFFVTAVAGVASILLYLGYFIYFEFKTSGQTIGKRYMGLRVVKSGGGAMSFTDVLIRNLMRGIDAYAFYAVAGLAMFFTPNTQRLGDLIARTVVISEQKESCIARSESKSGA